MTLEQLGGVVVTWEHDSYAYAAERVAEGVHTHWPCRWTVLRTRDKRPEEALAPRTTGMRACAS